MRSIKTLMTMVLAAAAAAGCAPSYELVTKSKIEGAESKPYAIRNYTLEVVDFPSGSSPEISVKIQRQRFWIETAKGVKQRFRKYSDGKLEAEQGQKQVTDLARITGQTEWIPAPNETIVFTVPFSGRSASMSTDESGVARFSVAEYAEEWIEGRDVDVDVKAQLGALTDQEVWEKVKNKHPKDAKDLLKVEDREFQQTVTVRARVLQSIFERK